MDALVTDWEKDDFLNSFEKLYHFSCPVYGTMSRKDLLQQKCSTALLTCVDIQTEVGTATLAKMAVALAINEDN